LLKLLLHTQLDARMHTHTHTHSRTPLYEWSARRRGRYLHNTPTKSSEEHPCPQRNSKLRSIQLRGSRNFTVGW